MSETRKPGPNQDAREYYSRLSHAELLEKVIILDGLAKAALQRNQYHRAKANRDATHDDLTGILNRRGLKQAYEDRKTHRSRRTDKAKPDIVAFIDLDEFKQINDRYGHNKGDEALQSVVELIKSSLREGDVFGRYGGDEFMAFMQNATIEEAHAKAKNIQLYVARVAEAATLEVPLPTLSIGLAEIDYSMPFKDMYTAADLMMYEGKKAGRNQVSILRPNPTA